MVYTGNFIRLEDIRSRVATDADMLAEMGISAAHFILSRPWCEYIRQGYLDRGLGNVIAVFYFEFERADSADEDVPTSTWVVDGDVPRMIIPPSVACDGMEALDQYVRVLGEWCAAVRNGDPVDELPPVYQPYHYSILEPTDEHVDRVESQLRKLRGDIVPWLADWDPNEVDTEEGEE